MKRPYYKNANYIDIQKDWKYLGPIFRSKTAYGIWKPHMMNYANQRAAAIGRKYHVGKAQFPSDFDSCDWRWNRGRRGPQPAFWDYVCHGACHWLADLGWYVASTAYPQTKWYILTSDKHSTVWNADYKHPVLFDINGVGIGGNPDDSLKDAFTNGIQLKYGVPLYDIP